jgi:glutathione S-transferase
MTDPTHPAAGREWRIAMLTLFHAPWSRSGRLVWLLEEIGTNYDIHYCDIARQDGSGARDPANPHPDGKVPALKHGDVLVTECLAVALYLTDQFPEAELGAAVGTVERGAFLTWLAWAAGELEPALWSRMAGADQDVHARARYDAAISRVLGALEAGPYLMGDRFTAVDVMVGSTLGWARQHVPESAAIDAYLARVSERPANKQACEKDAPAAAAA